MKWEWLRTILVVIAISFVSGGLAPDLVRGQEPYDPVINPGDFIAEINNRYLPLVPGTTFVYEAETEDGLVRDVVAVTRQKKKILGVTCTVVRDTEWVDGELAEDTFDWYAQDRHGNVWYFGEFTTEYEDGQAMGHEGSWEAGVGGAKPGIIMLADPRPGDSYRQEYLEDVAEDMATVLRLDAHVSVTAGDFVNCLVTKEWTPLEPGHIEHKHYAPGVGLVLITEFKGKNVHMELVEITS